MCSVTECRQQYADRAASVRHLQAEAPRTAASKGLRHAAPSRPLTDILPKPSRQLAQGSDGLNTKRGDFSPIPGAFARHYQARIDPPGLHAGDYCIVVAEDDDMLVTVRSGFFENMATRSLRRATA
jgi:hypothetical protein